MDVDISAIAIAVLLDAFPTADCAIADVFRLPFRDSSFRCLVDKGTVDAVLSGPDKLRLAREMFAELLRVVCPSGLVLIASMFPPDVRLYHFAIAEITDVTVTELPFAPLELPKQSCMWLYSFRVK
jgi:ubiquinone/menaquinone biosynthesis C-methylase UbiE